MTRKDCILTLETKIKGLTELYQDTPAWCLDERRSLKWQIRCFDNMRMVLESITNKQFEYMVSTKDLEENCIHYTPTQAKLNF